MTSVLPPPPPRAAERFADPRRALFRAAPGPAVVAGVVLGGVAFDLGVRHPAGLVSFVAIGIVIIASRVGGWASSGLSTRLLVVALVPAALLMLRDSQWLVPLNVIAALGLVLLAAAVRSETGAVARAIGRLARIDQAVEPAVMGFGFVGQSATASMAGRGALRHRLVRVGRGALIAVPVAGTLVALLAASDALFRSWLDIPVDGPSIMLHLSLIILGATCTVTLVGHGFWAEPAPPLEPRRRLGSTETTVILGGVVAVYTAFAVAQVVATAAGSDYVLQTTGLTYSEYARTGFFQLLAAAILTLVVLLLVSQHRAPASPRALRRIGLLEMATVALTLTVVAVAIRRLFLYEAEFGLTMLRLYTIVFAGFIGVVFLIVGLALRGRLRRHPVSLIATVAFATLITVNLVNPEALVAQRNIDRFGGTPDLDIEYLTEDLGPDAIPTVMTDPVAAAAICAAGLDIDDRAAVFNWGRSNAGSATQSC